MSAEQREHSQHKCHQCGCVRASEYIIFVDGNTPVCTIVKFGRTCEHDYHQSNRPSGHVTDDISGGHSGQCTGITKA